MDGARVPQGCLYLLGAAERAGHEVRFRDYQTAKSTDLLDVSTFTEFLEDDSDVVALSCMSNLLPLVVEATRSLKQRFPEKTILLGGIGPSGVAERLMAEFDHIDLICKGEGEETFPELLSALASGRPPESVPGVLARDKDGGLHRLLPRQRSKELDSMPQPAYHRVNMKLYETVGIQTARGCPFPCTFCDVSAYWGRRTSYRSIPPVLDEMEQLEKQYGFRRLTLLDDTFILKRERVAAFCLGWQERRLSIEWSAYCRVDLLDDSLVDMLADAGCYRVFLGIESGSNRILQQIAKPIDRHHLARMVRRMARRFVVRCNLIWGFPFETLEDLKETVMLLFYLRELKCDVSLALLSPLPMSTIYNKGDYELVLRDDLQSSVVSSRFYLPDGSGLVDGKPDRLVELIRQYPDIFPGFYVFKDDLFEEKLAYLYSMGLDIEKLERP
ncbi:MAG: B12-binding domain-containing radical SAM protein [Zoogloeaceae bacterium]|nr:B12-binding domain-containing radical SAM protein [Zoogloeaceae bacterium]